MALGNLLIRTLAPATLAALALAACGSQQKPAAATTTTTTTTTGSKPAPPSNRVVIYSSLPHGGPQRAASLQIEHGIRLALAPIEHRLYNGFRVYYKPLNDSYMRVVRHGHGANSPSTRDRSSSGITTVSAGNSDGWNPTATVNAAELAARNPRTVAYIGDLDSGATELSLPILNQAGILQITPGSGYPGLTDSYKGITATAPSSEPERYYPHSPHNLLRLIPNDVVQAGALLSLLHSGGCQKFSVWRFGGGLDEPEQAALQAAVIRTAPEYQMKYVAPPKPLGTDTKSYFSYWQHVVEPLDLHCAVLVGRVTRQAVAFTTELRLQLPSAAIAATNGFCGPAWAGGIAKTNSKTYAKDIEAGLYCTTPTFPIGHYPHAKGFIAAFRRAYHSRPNAYAYYGYQAAAMVMRVLHDIDGRADSRQVVLNDLHSEFPSGLTGPFAFEGGDVTSDAYGVDHFKNGALRYFKRVTPTYYLLPSG